MRGAEAGFLLLCSHLGDYKRKPLSQAAYRRLAALLKNHGEAEDRELRVDDLTALGYEEAAAAHMIDLLSQEAALAAYLQKGQQMDCSVLTRISAGYPLRLHHGLGMDAPACLWAKGDVTLLETPMVALVGSRELHPANLAFAKEVGRQAALQGYTLVSGNAKGADRAAQDSCLEHGGNVVSVVADRLDQCPLMRRVLYLSEDSYDLRFSTTRALRRNRIIHALPLTTFVAQCTRGKGGTWDGTTANLTAGWSPVKVFADGSMATEALTALGATAITMEEIKI